MILIVLAVLAADGGVPPLEELRGYLRAGEVWPGESEEANATAAYMLTKPKPMRVLLSARVCMLAKFREETLSEIAAEKKYSAIGGAVDLKKLHDLQLIIRADDDRIEIQKKALGAIGAKALACSDQEVAGVARCLRTVYDAMDEGVAVICGGSETYFQNMEIISKRRGTHAFVQLPWQSQRDLDE